MFFLSRDQLRQFEIYYQFLLEKNKLFNLTSIIDEDEVIDKHFVDSLTCCRVVDMSQVSNVIDIGTGAGFPGIPLKIAFPHLYVILVDSLKKRVNFLNELISLLGLTGIYAIHGRAEDLARDDIYRGRFDLCVSRAVANLNTLSEYCIPFVRVNGYFVSYKSVKGLEEMKNCSSCLHLLGSKIIYVDDFALSSQDYRRILIKIKKCENTSNLYPRKAGIPLKNPL
ncbi:MAG: 16S rRNA (guanine(527)-N(7))-methyltransferase RsmG [Clostridiales bacterium]|nr:16S rRNA (guanine(527)-N(7))-methyltransferase RsmG [Clostridiales bacterium]